MVHSNFKENRETLEFCVVQHWFQVHEEGPIEYLEYSVEPTAQVQQPHDQLVGEVMLCSCSLRTNQYFQTICGESFGYFGLLFHMATTNIRICCDLWSTSQRWTSIFHCCGLVFSTSQVCNIKVVK